MGTNSLSTFHVGSVAAGASATLFFYLKASAATAVDETHSITLYNGETGSNFGPMAISPAVLDSWKADVFHLTSASTVFTASGTTFTDALSFTIPASSNLAYTTTYTFRVTSVTSGQTTIYPANFIASGSNMKHTDTTSYAFAPIAAPQNFLHLTRMP